MPTKTLYLTSTATSSPYPTTSRLLSETNNASEVTLGPGEFDSGFPGNTDCGQWRPSSPIADTTSAAEIDNTGASPGTARQGWLWNQDLAGQTLAAGAWSFQLRLRANQGTASETGRIVARVSIVTASGGVWTTVKSIFTTNIVGETSHSTGQAGWRSQTEARIGPSSTAANFTVTVGDAGTTQSHTFAAGERILVELGFGDGSSLTDRTWRLDYNTANSFITTPSIATAISGTAAGTGGQSGALTGTGALAGTSTGTAGQTGALTGIGALSGIAAGIATATAIGSLIASIGGTAAGAATAEGDLTGSGGSGEIAGTAVGSGAAFATLSGVGELNGTAEGLGAASGNLTGSGGAPPPTTTNQRSWYKWNTR
jgi:hypothetical protein